MRTPRLYRAVDVSNWTGEITLDTIKAWRTAGVNRLIVRASVEDHPKMTIARQQLRIAKQARLARHAYLWLYFMSSLPPEEQMALALAVCHGFGVQRLWLDCEDASPWDAPQTVDWIRRAVMAAGDMPVGIYSRLGWWVRATGDSRLFAHLPLWDADPDGVMRIDSFMPYGGWQKRAVKQTHFNTELGGVNVNLNVYRTGAS